MHTFTHYWFQSDEWPSQLLRFGLVGGSGTLVGLAAVNGVMLASGSFLLANGLAFFAAVTWNYMLNRRLTFERSDRPLLGQWASFAAGSAAGAMVNWMVALPLYYSHPFFEHHYNLAVLIGVAAGAACNFLWARCIAFAPRLDLS